MTTPTLTATICEGDTLIHIEDTRLFWVMRNGRLVSCSWNELTITERQYQREAEARANYTIVFNIY